jgi:hypothetical protein
VTNDFDVVAVRIEDEGTVVIRMIMGSQARRAVIFLGSEGGDEMRRPASVFTTRKAT